MPKKIRELKSRPLKAGFNFRSGKERHTVRSHPRLRRSLTLSGNDGDDAKPYQERAVSEALQELGESS